ncbi:MAG: response regulator [Kiritimatiellia bacterium]
MIKVMVVDDHPVVRGGLEAMFESTRGFRVVGMAGDGEEAVAIFRKKLPDVVVMDIRMPGMDGFATLEKMKRFVPDVKVLLLAGMPLETELQRARSIGAKGYLPKNVDHARLLDAVLVASANGPFQEEPLPEVPCILSARELEVLRYLALGKTRDEVSAILGIASETVKSHAHSIQLKLGAPNTAGAVSRGYELGILRA